MFIIRLASKTNLLHCLAYKSLEPGLGTKKLTEAQRRSICQSVDNQEDLPILFHASAAARPQLPGDMQVNVVLEFNILEDATLL